MYRSGIQEAVFTPALRMSRPSFRLIITVIITAICLPPGGPADNLTSIVSHDLLPWEQKINNQSMDYDGRGGEVWNICVKKSQCINGFSDTYKL